MSHSNSHIPAPDVSQLPDIWRARAAELRRTAAAEGPAVAFECAAGELADAIGEAADELLTLPQAARICGYTADHLGRLVRAGILTNRGRRNAPRLRRGDLPMKPGALPAEERADPLFLARRIAADIRR